MIPHIVGPFRRGVLVGIDGLGVSMPAITCAAQEVERLGEPLGQLCAVPCSRETQMGDDDRSPLDAAAGALVAEWLPEVFVRVARRSVADVLLCAAGRAALLVPGTCHADREEAVAGPVARDVLVNINAPVNIARAPAR